MSKLSLLVVLACLLGAQALCPAYTPTQLASPRSICNSWGDPHLTCFSGAKYDDMCMGQRLHFKHNPTCLTVRANQAQWTGTQWPAAIQDKIWISADASCNNLLGPSLCTIDSIETSGAGLIIAGMRYAFSSFTRLGQRFQGFVCAAGSSTSQVVLTFDASNIQVTITYNGQNGYATLISLPQALATAAGAVSGICQAQASCSSPPPPATAQPGAFTGAVKAIQAATACSCLTGIDYNNCLYDCETFNSLDAARAAVSAVALAQSKVQACSITDALIVSNAIATATASCSLCGPTCLSAVQNMQSVIGARLQCCGTDASLAVKASTCLSLAVGCGCL